MLHAIHYSLGRLVARQETLLATVTVIERRQRTIDHKLTRLDRRVETLEQAKPQISKTERTLVSMATYLLPLLATLLGLWVSKGDLSAALELAKLFAPR